MFCGASNGFSLCEVGFSKPSALRAHRAKAGTAKCACVFPVSKTNTLGDEALVNPVQMDQAFVKSWNLTSREKSVDLRHEADLSSVKTIVTVPLDGDENSGLVPPIQAEIWKRKRGAKTACIVTMNSR